MFIVQGHFLKNNKQAILLIGTKRKYDIKYIDLRLMLLSNAFFLQNRTCCFAFVLSSYHIICCKDILRWRKLLLTLS